MADPFDVVLQAECVRQITFPVEMQPETAREVCFSVKSCPEVERRVYKYFDPKNIKSITFNLSAKDVVPEYTIETPYPMRIDGYYVGRLFDHYFRLRVKKTSYNFDTGLITAIGVDDHEAIANDLCSFTIPSEASAKSIMTSLAGVLGKELVWYGDDFTTTAFYFYPVITGINLSQSSSSQTSAKKSTNPGTYLEVISKLFGWSSNTPNHQYTVTIRNDKVIVVQRGHEPNPVAPQNFKRNSEDSEKIWTLRGLFDSSDDSTGQVCGDASNETTDQRINGTWSAFGSTMEYTNGQLTFQRTQNSGGGYTVAYYNYSNDYLVQKRQTTVSYDNGKTVTTDVATTYEYAPYFDGEMRLVREFETTTKTTEGGSPESHTRETFYSTNDGDVFTSSTYDDGKFTSGSPGRGAPGGKASPWTRKMQNQMFITDVPSVKIAGVPIDGQQYQIDRCTLQRIADDLTWLNGKILHTANIDSVDDHIYDFVDLITVDGLSFHLESNQVKFSVDEGKITYSQQLSLVRWY